MKLPSINLPKVMTDVECAYVAGFFDGEGSIYCVAEKRPQNRSGFRFIVMSEVSNTVFDVLRDIREMTGNGFVSLNTQYKDKNYKPLYKLKWNSSQQQRILPQLIPHFRVKKKQALLALEFFSLVSSGNNYGKNQTERQAEIWEELSTLNGRGMIRKKKDLNLIIRNAIKKPTRYCSIDDCDRVHYGRDLCELHYKKLVYKEKKGAS